MCPTGEGDSYLLSLQVSLCGVVPATACSEWRTALEKHTQPISHCLSILLWGARLTSPQPAATPGPLVHSKGNLFDAGSVDASGFVLWLGC